MQIVFTEVDIHEVCTGITLTTAEREQKQLGVFIDLYSFPLCPAFINVNINLLF